MIVWPLGWRPRRPSRASLGASGSPSRTPWESTLVEPWVCGLFGWIDATGGPLVQTTVDRGQDSGFADGSLREKRVRRHAAMTPSSAERDDTPSLR